MCHRQPARLATILEPAKHCNRCSVLNWIQTKQCFEFPVDTVLVWQILHPYYITQLSVFRRLPLWTLISHFCILLCLDMRQTTFGRYLSYKCCQLQAVAHNPHNFCWIRFRLTLEPRSLYLSLLMRYKEVTWLQKVILHTVLIRQIDGRKIHKELLEMLFSTLFNVIRSWNPSQTEQLFSKLDLWSHLVTFYM